MSWVITSNYAKQTKILYSEGLGTNQDETKAEVEIVHQISRTQVSIESDDKSAQPLYYPYR